MLHHAAHHQAYITNLNALLGTYRTTTNQSDATLLTKLRFHAGGHLNHALFWPSLAPSSSSPSTQIASATPKLSSALVSQFGSFDAFVEAFSVSLLGIKGSGWGWLGVDTKATLGILQTKGQKIVGERWWPLLGIDMWEQSYYLLYLSEKERYVEVV